MLIALNRDGARVPGWIADKEEEYHCQQCEQKLILKKGLIKVHHFAHYPDSSPCTWWEPETEKHLRMKEVMMKLLRRDNKIEVAEFEYKLKYVEGINLYPDIYIFLRNGKRVAVECQVSNKPLQDFILKTERYSSLGIHTLWVFSDDEYHTDDNDERRISNIRLQSHYWNFGRIYVLINGNLYAVHFYPVQRDNSWTGRSYYLKTTKGITTCRVDNARLLCIKRGDNGFNEEIGIARFYDKKWWN